VNQRLAENGVRWDAPRLVERGIAGQRPQQLDPAQRSRGDQLPGAGKRGVEAALKADLQWDSGETGGGDGPVGIGQVLGDRFLTEHGLASLRGGDDGFRVEPRRSGDDDCFDGRISEQMLVVERPARAAQPGRLSLGETRLRVGEADEPRTRDATGQILGMMRAHHADADDGYADRRLGDQGKRRVRHHGLEA